MLFMAFQLHLRLYRIDSLEINLLTKWKESINL